MRAPTEQVISISRLICVGCGSETNATCNCGLEYKPKAARAKEAIEANPEKSNRAIAAEIGADEKTVRKARRQLRTIPRLASASASTARRGRCRSARPRQIKRQSRAP